jgi:hypothetical protein
MLAYRTSADQLDEVLKIATSTCLETLGKFAEGVIEVFGAEYLRPPRSDELESIEEKMRIVVTEASIVVIGHGRIVRKVGRVSSQVVKKVFLL